MALGCGAWVCAFCVRFVLILVWGGRESVGWCWCVAYGGIVGVGVVVGNGGSVGCGWYLNERRCCGALLRR